MADIKISELPVADALDGTELIEVSQDQLGLLDSYQVTVDDLSSYTRKGTSTNDSAPAGVIGEYIESVIAVGSAVSLTTLTAVNITSISLTAGDWDVRGVIRIHSTNAATSFTAGIGSIGLVSNTLDSINQASIGGSAFVPGNGVNYCAFGIPSARISLASTTNVYLVSRATFTASSAAAYGIISARRVR